jgi:hypothetical protein
MTSIATAPHNRQWSLRDQRGHTIPCPSRRDADQWLGHPGITVIGGADEADCTGCCNHRNATEPAAIHCLSGTTDTTSHPAIGAAKDSRAAGELQL